MPRTEWLAPISEPRFLQQEGRTTQSPSSSRLGRMGTLTPNANASGAAVRVSGFCARIAARSDTNQGPSVRQPNKGPPMSSAPDQLNEQIGSFRKTVRVAIATSNAHANKYAKVRFGWATWIYSRLCLQANSIEMLIDGYLYNKMHSSVDHASIGLRARSMLEGDVIISYLLEAA
jgi:hypothetical protein